MFSNTALRLVVMVIAPSSGRYVPFISEGLIVLHA